MTSSLQALHFRNYLSGHSISLKKTKKLQSMKVNILSIIIKQISSTTVKERTKNITAKKKKKKKIGGLLFLRKASTNQSLLNKTKGKPNHWADKS